MPPAGPPVVVVQAAPPGKDKSHCRGDTRGLRCSRWLPAAPSSEGTKRTVVARLHCSANLRCACSASHGGGREGHREDGDGNDTARGGSGKRGLRCSTGYRLVFPARGPTCADAPALGRPAMRLLVPNSPHASNAGAGPGRLLVEGRVGDEQEDEEAGEESPVEWEGISRGRGHARDWGRLLGFPSSKIGPPDLFPAAPPPASPRSDRPSSSSALLLRSAPGACSYSPACGRFSFARAWPIFLRPRSYPPESARICKPFSSPLPLRLARSRFCLLGLPLYIDFCGLFMRLCPRFADFATSVRRLHRLCGLFMRLAALTAFVASSCGSPALADFVSRARRSTSTLRPLPGVMARRRPSRRLALYIDFVASSHNLTESLMFLAHFVGDVTSPSRKTRAGTPSAFVNVQTWDVSIIETVMKNLYDRDLDTMVEALQTNLTNGWSDDISQWENCANKKATCANDYAVESVGLACKYAYADAVNGTVLGDEYYNSRYPIVERRLAQGGIRLALILNRIFDKTTKVDTIPLLQVQ
ncbi:hypothetical protein QYE76_049084 [Lolium multiflorum]|uniref:Aspergillus nuclease S1 n=1 Tax=Lolium multiflorum TaxID=4521 RepID=A0AAD8WHZ4_LOLMU|nr:hypothetical protein QYE76_049084 [Lolium multiflorum]